MTLRRALSSLSLVVLAGAAALVPTAASATPATITVQDATVQFQTRTTAQIVVSYTCGSAESPTSDVLGVTIYQPLADDDYQAAADNPVDGTPVQCDGTQQLTSPIPLEVTEGEFANGGAEAAMLIGDDPDDAVFQEVTAVGVPEPQIAVEVNASPEVARKGKKITVKGSVTRDDKPVKVKATLLFAKDGGDYTKVKSVTSDKKGKLSTTVKATSSGTFAYRYDTVTSGGDHIEVIPVAKKYKNCTALNKVYPHGVGKSGAQDKGGSVTDFTVDGSTYAKNKKSDRDKDGIACEQA